MTWTAERLTQLATGYWPAAALIAATQLGVFDALCERPVSAEAAAGRLSVEQARLAPLLDALVAIGLLAKTNDTYAVPADLRPFLDRASPACLLDGFAYNADLYRQWADLAGVVQGTRPPGGRPQLGGDPERTRRFVHGMESKARTFAPLIADAIDLGSAGSLLDVGSGPGTLSRVLAERSRGLAVTLLDLPPVLAVTKEICADSPVADRLRFHAADYRQDPLPGGFDAALYAGALHQETLDSAAALLAAVRNSLKPAGRLFVVDMMLDDDRTSPPFSALFQLNMLLLRPGSRVFSTAELTSLLTTCGFEDCHATDIAGTPYRLVSATRA